MIILVLLLIFTTIVCYEGGWFFEKLDGGLESYGKYVINQDNGYMTAGFSNWNVMYTFFSHEGEMKKRNTINGTFHEYLGGMTLSEDEEDGFVFQLNSKSWGTGTPDTYRTGICKIKRNGEIDWYRSFGSPEICDPVDITRNSNGGYFSTVIITEGRYTPESTQDLGLIKFDWNGEILESIYFSILGGYDYTTGIAEYEDDGVLVSGFSDIIPGFGHDNFAAAFNSSLGLVWLKGYYDVSFLGEYSQGILRTEDKNNYFMFGCVWIEEGIDTAFIINLDSTGDVNWSFVYGTRTFNEVFYGVIETSNDNGFLCLGFTTSITTNEDGIIVKLDSNGNIIWAIVCILKNASRFNDAVETTNGYFIDGLYENDIGDQRELIVKVDFNGKVSLECSPTYFQNFTDIEKILYNVTVVDITEDVIVGDLGWESILEENVFATDITNQTVVNRICQNCTNDERYFGDYCRTKCYGVVSNNTLDVCNGNGDCIDLNNCVCNDEHFGDFCNITKCFGVLDFISSVCSGRGKCIGFDICECSEHYFGDFCNITKCMGIFNNETENVCYGHGKCIDLDICECDSSYFGQFCNITKCYGVWNNISINSVCKQHGECIIHDHCDCFLNYFGERCSISECYGVLSNQTDTVCESYGVCEDYNVCNCSSKYYGQNCNLTTCYGLNDTNSCSKKGKCYPFNKCSCDTNFYGLECNITTCNGELSNSSKICNGHGICSLETQICECFGIFSGSDCTIFNIFKTKDIENQILQVDIPFEIEIPINSFGGYDDSFLWMVDYIPRNFDNNNDIKSKELPPIMKNIFNTGIYYPIQTFFKNSHFYLLVNEDNNTFCGFMILDITNFTDIIYYDSFVDTGPVSKMYVSEKEEFVVISTISGEFRIYNITNLSSITLITNFTHSEIDIDHFAVYKDQFLFICDPNDISIFDLETFSYPGNIDIDDCISIKFDQENEYAFILNNQDINVVDIEDIGESEIIYYEDRISNPHDFLVIKNREICVVVDDDKLRIFDISDIETFEIISEFILDSSSSGYKITNIVLGGPNDNYIFTGFDIFDISNLTHPERIHVFNTTGIRDNDNNNNCNSVSLNKNDIYVTFEDTKDIFIYEFGSVSVYGTIPFSECGNTETIRIEGRNNLGDVLNSTFDIFVIGTGSGNIVNEDCTLFLCDSILSNETESVCNGNGECIYSKNILNLVKGECICHGKYDPDSFCEECLNDYSGDDCLVTTCNGIKSDDIISVCSGHGLCWPKDKCDCVNQNYTGENCEFWNCGGIWNNNTREICSAHGNCDSYDECDCIDSYNGENCEFWECFGVLSADVNNVCFGHGSCVSVDMCFCQTGYTSSFNMLGYPCDYWECNDVPGSKYNEIGCNFRGNCTSSEFCECKEGYLGVFCENWKCSGLDKDQYDSVCSGNGKCIAPDECDCDSGYIGEFCDENLYLSIILAPVLSVAGVSFIGIFSILLILCFLCCCVCIFSLIFIFYCSVACLCCFICCLLLFTCVLRFRVKKFSKLKNFDILMKEQELEEDESIAHIKITKVLFKINYNEIKMIRILGQGGSNSTGRRRK